MIPQRKPNIPIKQWFIIDGVGACLSALLLLTVLWNLQELFGIPTRVLMLLVVPPVIFAAYDAYCWFSQSSFAARRLRNMAMANLAYIGFSLSLLLLHLDEITTWGVLYLVGEMIVVFILYLLEWKVSAKALQSN